jgi:hypothetical protein
MTKLRLLWLIAIILQLPILSQGQFSREQAKELVLKQVLVSDLDHINVYSSFDAKSDPVGLNLMYNRVIPLPYSSNWIFFSDDNPYANWCHSCRYVMVSADNGDYTIENSDIFPQSLRTGYEQISQISPPYQSITLSYTAQTPNYATPNSHLHALLISGDDAPRFNRDIATVYNTLKEQGYLKSNITVLYNEGSASSNPPFPPWGGDFDNDSVIDINNNAYHSTVDATFEYLHATLTDEDQLFVYVTDHGGLDMTQGLAYIMLPTNGGNAEYTTTDLVTHIRNIGCAQMIFMLQECNSGAFIDPILNDVQNSACKNRLVQTACGGIPGSLSYAEMYITNALYDELTFYWTAAIRGYYPAVLPWQWGPPVGSFPFQYFPVSHGADYNPDNGSIPVVYGPVSPGNSDSFTQFIEVFNYANCMDSYSTYGFYNPYSGLVYETPMYGINNGFSDDDLFCLNGIAGNTSTNLPTAQTVDSRSYLLGGNLTVFSPITLLENVQITMGVNNSIIDVQQNAQFTVGNNSIFTGTSLTTPNGIYVHNSNNSLLTLNHATFKNAFFEYNGQPLAIIHSSFTACPVVASHHGDVSIDNTTFVRTPLVLDEHDPLANTTATVTSCTFTGPFPGNAALVENYKNYSLTDNSIDRATDDGLSLYFCGHGTGSQLIQRNTISNCGQSGLILYFSDATITMNHIGDNQFGIKLLNSSNTSLTGNMNALDYSGTQEINDNTSVEIYASNNSLPYMRYNAIIDDDNQGSPNDPLLFYDNSQGNGKFDVAYNCWGPYFDPGSDLFANYGIFKPYPVWSPGSGGMPYGGMDADMYNTAEGDIEVGNYSAAKNLFQLLIETFPESDYAQASLKEMFAIEPDAGNDFNGLRNFYLTNDSILADSILMKIGDFLANRCNVQIENYSDAISWYEEKIQNPELETDSIFAIIDLGDIYLHMDTTGNRPFNIGSLPQYKPESPLKFGKYRDSLISLLPFPKKTDLVRREIRKLKAGQLLQNVPNPSSSSTDIYFKLLNANNASINIYDSWGRLNQQIPLSELNDGVHKTLINTSRLSPGVYDYSLLVNNQLTDSKRMIVIR